MKPPPLSIYIRSDYTTSAGVFPVIYLERSGWKAQASAPKAPTPRRPAESASRPAAPGVEFDHQPGQRPVADAHGLREPQDAGRGKRIPQVRARSRSARRVSRANRARSRQPAPSGMRKRAAGRRGALRRPRRRANRDKDHARIFFPARRHRITIFAPGRAQRTACRMASSGMAMQPDVLEPPPMQCRKMQEPSPASPAAL